jgi:hypothetical protein
MDESSGTTLNSNERGARGCPFPRERSRGSRCASQFFWSACDYRAKHRSRFGAARIRSGWQCAHGANLSFPRTERCSNWPAPAPARRSPAFPQTSPTSGRRLVYRPNNAFLGGDTFAFSIVRTAVWNRTRQKQSCKSSLLLACRNDVWDVSTASS